jgi:hypothetical protein
MLNSTHNFECNDNTNAETSNYMYFYLISILGLIGNTLVFLYFYKKVNLNSTNRAYIMSIAIVDMIFIIINFFDTKFSSSLNYNFICQINNYCINSSKNLSALLLLVLIINNLVRCYEGSYSLGTVSCIGQACSKSSLIFTLLTVLALSYYNLWNKSLPAVPNNDNICCGFVAEFNPRFTYRLENGILFLIYISIAILSIVLFVVFYKKNLTLHCNSRRDPVVEKEMVIGISFVSLFTSIFQIFFFINLFIELDSSLAKFELLMKNIDYQDYTETNSTYVEEKENQYLEVEYMILVAFSFKFFIYLITMRSYRNFILKSLRIKFSINPFIMFNHENQLANEHSRLISENFSWTNNNTRCSHISTDQPSQKQQPVCSYNVKTDRLSLNTEQIPKKLSNKRFSLSREQLKIFSIKINGFKSDII